MEKDFNKKEPKLLSIYDIVRTHKTIHSLFTRSCFSLPKIASYPLHFLIFKIVTGSTC